MGQRLITIDELSFDFQDLVGEGSFGAVYRGTYSSAGVAVKRVLKNQVDVDATILHKAHQQGFHPNILIYNCVKHDNHFTYIISELAVGNLQEVIYGHYKGPPILNDNHIGMLQQITLGLQHLHKNEIIHRDLKPTNILVSISSDTGLAVMKLADFGIFRIVQGERSEHALATGRSNLFRASGTNGWIAPEMFSPNMSFPVDIYALGITFAFTLTGNHPFGPNRLDRLVLMEEGKPIIQSVRQQLQETNPEILTLIQRMLKVNPNERPTATAVLAHAIFKPPVVKVEQAAIERSTTTLNDDIEPVPSTSTQTPSAPPTEAPNVKAEVMDEEPASIQSTVAKKARLSLSESSNSFTSSNNTVAMPGSQSGALDPDGATDAVEAPDNKQVLEEELLELCSFDNVTETGLARLSELVADKTVDINCRDPESNLTPLLLLCWSNQSDSLSQCVQVLLERDEIDLKAKDNNNNDALAILQDMYSGEEKDFITCLIDSKLRLAIKSESCLQSNSNSSNALRRNLLGASDQPADALPSTSNGNGNITARDATKEAALLVLCHNKKLDEEGIAQLEHLVMDTSVSINCTDPNGRSPLLILCWRNQSRNLFQCLNILIQRKDLNLNAKTNEGENAILLLCTYYKRPDLIELLNFLIERGVQVNTKQKSGYHALHRLCQYYTNVELPNVIRLLIEKRIDVNSKIRTGETALLLLTFKQHGHPKYVQVARMLIENGADVNVRVPNVKGHHGRTVLLTLCESYKQEDLIDIIQLLIENKVDLNAAYPEDKYHKGFNSLLLLCQNYEGNNLLDILKLFIDNNADVNYVTKQKDCVLNMLCHRYRKPNLIDLIRLLINRINLSDRKIDAWKAVELLTGSGLADEPEIIQLIIRR